MRALKKSFFAQMIADFLQMITDGLDDKSSDHLAVFICDNLCENEGFSTVSRLKIYFMK